MTDETTGGMFVGWFRRGLAARDWRAAELAQGSGPSPSPSNVGERLPGEHLHSTGGSAQATADALGIRIDVVLAPAGVGRVSGDSAADAPRQRINALVELLPDDRLETVVDILEGLRAGDRRRTREGQES